MEGWLAYLVKLSLASPKTTDMGLGYAPTTELPMSYSPMILPSFDEEEYMNRPKENEDAADNVVPSVNEAEKLAKEVGNTTMGETRETTAQGADKDATQDLPPKL